MRSAEIESAIALTEKQRDTLKARLDGLLQRLQNELPAAAEGWIRREVERQISDHPETVNNLGISKIKLLKERMNALIASLPDLAKQEMADTKQWPQNFAGINDRYFDDVFRRLISSLGLLLDQFGLLKSPEGRYQSWQQSGPDNFRYAINTGFDQLSIPARDEFQQAYEEFKKLTAALRKKQEELVKVKAQELWDSA